MSTHWCRKVCMKQPTPRQALAAKIAAAAKEYVKAVRADPREPDIFAATYEPAD